MSAAALRAGLVATITGGLLDRELHVWVAAADDLPEDDNHWPFVVVRAPQTVRTRRIGSVLWRVWTVQIVAGTRSAKGDADAADEAAASRDTLMTEVASVLSLHRGVAPGITARLGAERRGAVVPDRNGRRWTVGEITVTASGPEVPAPEPPTYLPTDLQITVTASGQESAA